MNIFGSPQTYLKYLLMVCSCIVGFALFNEYVLHVHACKLCHYQQALYGIVILILLIHMFTKSLSVIFIMIVTSVVFLINMGIAGYQVMLEQHIIQLPDLCQKPLIKAQTLQDLRAHFQNHPHVPCDEVRWSLGGISMAGYNVIINSVLIFLNLIMSKRYYRAEV